MKDRSLTYRGQFRSEFPDKKVLDGRATYFTESYVDWLELKAENQYKEIEHLKGLLTDCENTLEILEIELDSADFERKKACLYDVKKTLLKLAESKLKQLSSNTLDSERLKGA